ncbi:hypothetical protein EKO29_16200 [Colwellia sp. Arc7-635]|uniref:lytic polysaccharide monooxygenase n=1 Tax=Colwellia sp. Arc7-635 TaxID=2497879 RepID=UPI000F857F98|nr:lytic polysaccharide monooxygenase [Colwellia sp. Arc7-635]AZQ85389.1 hypothetical protein EKO29_16200 [Colwellia sp. Arc7-635]
MKKYTALFTFSLLSSMTLVSISAYSHAYLTSSRAKLCQERQNLNCGPVIYEPQSLEGMDGFSSSGPKDGTIASAGREDQWSLLNEQTPTRWKKVAMTSGSNTFQWNFKALHRTKDYKYYITKQGWDSTQPLSRSAFDLTPFCQVQGNNALPAQKENHRCNVPNRTGYQIILGVWDVSDTDASFYNVIDAEFSKTAPDNNYNDIGDITPTSSLAIGALVKLRLFTNQGELADQTISMAIENIEQGDENTWPKILADKVNVSDILKAGIKNAEGEINSSYGHNDVFAKNGTKIIRTEVFIDNNNVVTPKVNLNVNVNETNYIAGEAMALEIVVEVDEAMDIETQLFFNNISMAYQKQKYIVNNAHFNININNAEQGHYRLVTTGKVLNSAQFIQRTVAIFVAPSSGDNIDEIVAYPTDIGTYLTGSLVKGEDGGIYTCIIAPWCNGSSDYYAPELGLSWQSAWEKRADITPPETPNADYIYPAGKGQYTSSDIVEDDDDEVYRCNITNWCNGNSSYYAPGKGSAWQTAWSRK